MNRDSLLEILGENRKLEMSAESHYQNLIFKIKNERIAKTLWTIFHDTERHVIIFSKLIDRVSKPK